jgi:hypothetical protein
MTTLVLLAAGMGSRFGGPKQLEPLGPNGETIMDYSLHDATRAGFGRAVLVVRPEMREQFAAFVERWSARTPVRLVDQRIDPLRTKPWGTAHAVLATRDVIDEPFAVANADDFYGRASFETLGRFLLERSGAYALVAYPIGVTLSPSGGVNRAVIRMSAEGDLTHVEEVRGIEQVDDRASYVESSGIRRDLALDAPISMNFWGFTPAIFGQLARAFDDFRRDHTSDPKAEFLIPSVLQTLVSDGDARVVVLHGRGRWCGLTHPADREPAREFLRSLTEQGEYPSCLWA